jgi:4-carboxymuconolactone decarboxylase
MSREEPRVLPLDESEWTSEQRELLTGGSPRPVLNIFRTLIRHPDLYRSWSAFGRQVLAHSTLDARTRELVILRTGHLCRSAYEFHQHTRIGKRAGLSDAEIEQIKVGPSAAGWTALERSCLTAADELHSEQRISDDTWSELSRHLDTKQLIDLVFAIGQYTLVSMALNSLGVQIERASGGDHE